MNKIYSGIKRTIVEGAKAGAYSFKEAGAASDIFFTLLAKTKKPKFDNKYFDLLIRYGFVKVMIRKTLLAKLVSAFIIDSSGNIFKLLPVLIVYSFFVFHFIISFLFIKQGKHLIMYLGRLLFPPMHLTIKVLEK